MQIEQSESEKFQFFVQYRSKCTEEFARSLHKYQAPCKVIMTLRKLKTVTPTFKPFVEIFLKSKFVYKIAYPHYNACYVSQTSHHLKARYLKKANQGPGITHFAQCDNAMTEDCIESLACSQNLCV